MEWSVFGATATAIVVLMLSMWLLSLRLRDASIVDIVWGFGFVVVAWVARATAHGVGARQNLLVAMTTIWGVRLAGYLFWRNHGKGEDYRYRSMRKHYGPRWTLVSLYLVFAMQGALMFAVSLPVQLGQMANRPTGIGGIAYAGVALWLVGVVFESVGDLQLARFKADPANKGLVMDRGLWRFTRHPNYFGDFCIWWGIFLVAAQTRIGLIGVLGPIVMSILLLRVSGVAMLERTIGRRRPGYAEYISRTSAFFPRPPRRT